VLASFFSKRIEDGPIPGVHGVGCRPRLRRMIRSNAPDIIQAIAERGLTRTGVPCAKIDGVDSCV